MTAIRQHTSCVHCLDTQISEGALTHAISLLPQWQPGFLPLFEVLGRVDRAADMALGPHAPVLRESRRADDGRLVDPPFTPDFVRAAVTLEGAVARVIAVVGGIVLVSKVLNDIVFDERIFRPAVQA